MQHILQQHLHADQRQEQSQPDPNTASGKCVGGGDRDKRKQDKADRPLQNHDGFPKRTRGPHRSGVTVAIIAVARKVIMRAC